MQDVGISDDEERDLCSGFNMAADVNLSFDNYEDIFGSTPGPTAAVFSSSPMDQDGMASIPEAVLFKPLNVRFFHSILQHISMFGKSISSSAFSNILVS